MSGLVPTLAFLHVVSTVGFVLVTSTLLGLSLLNRFRLRAPVLSWRPMSLRSAPWAPLSFVVLVAAVCAAAGAWGQALPTYFLVGYSIGGVAWLASSYISATVAVCECGIVGDVHRRDRAVSWGQVTDYFEVERGCGSEFVFLYQDEEKRQRRLEVLVPRRVRAQFVAVVEAQLMSRFERSGTPAEGKTALEG